jgi:hypothetical protein
MRSTKAARMKGGRTLIATDISRERSAMNAEQIRMEEACKGKAPWKKWGPCLSDRQWGTVREDYSDNGDAWNFFTHDQLGLGRIAGARTAREGSPTTSSGSAPRSPCGTARTRS